MVIECAHNRPFFKVFFSYMCNYKAKGNIILHFGANKTIQGIIFINLKKKKKFSEKTYFFGLKSYCRTEGEI
jgi:hypothetical protein